ncbi:hypothetical protein JB92DRAFT_3121623 [Gautieria morchelliformis]|nr:hypothetical protein JB92DRAFT_3121623 [Gautieria morchelliformis]
MNPHTRTPSVSQPFGINQIPLSPVPYAVAVPSSSQIAGTQYRPNGSSSTLNKSPLLVPLPDDWVAHVHPKGWLYYTNRSRKLVIDYKIETREGQDQLREALGEYEVLEADQLPSRCELWVFEGLNLEKPERLYVDHQERMVTMMPPKRGDSRRPGRRETLLAEGSEKAMKRSMFSHTKTPSPNVVKPRERPWPSTSESTSTNPPANGSPSAPLHPLYDPASLLAVFTGVPPDPSAKSQIPPLPSPIPSTSPKPPKNATTPPALAQSSAAQSHAEDRDTAPASPVSPHVHHVP